MKQRKWGMIKKALKACTPRAQSRKRIMKKVVNVFCCRKCCDQCESNITAKASFV